MDAEWSHKMQSIISGAYLSNLYGYEKGLKVGEIVTLEDLDVFYQKVIESRCPKNMVIEEIVWRFMSPFTSQYFQEDENLL